MSVEGKEKNNKEELAVFRCNHKKKKLTCLNCMDQTSVIRGFGNSNWKGSIRVEKRGIGGTVDTLV